MYKWQISTTVSFLSLYNNYLHTQTPRHTHTPTHPTIAVTTFIFSTQKRKKKKKKEKEEEEEENTTNKSHFSSQSGEQCSHSGYTPPFCSSSVSPSSSLRSASGFAPSRPGRSTAEMPSNSPPPPGRDSLRRRTTVTEQTAPFR